MLIWFLKLTLLIFSPVQFSSPPPIQQLDFCDSSPLFLRRSSLTSSLDDEDDGFLEVLDDNMEVRPLSLTFMKRTHLLSLRIFQNGFWYIWNHSLPWENRDHTLTGFTESQNSYSLLFKLRSHMISLWWSVLYLSDDTAFHLQNNSGMPMGMASLLTAPLVSDSAGEDSVSLNLVAEMFTIYIFINQF